MHHQFFPLSLVRYLLPPLAWFVSCDWLSSYKSSRIHLFYKIERHQWTQRRACPCSGRRGHDRIHDLERTPQAWKWVGGAQSPYFHPGNRENDLCSLSLTQAVIELPALGPASIPLPWPHCTLRATFPFSSQLPERPILHFSSHSKFSHGCMGALAHASCLMVGSSNLAHTNDEF